MKKIVNELGVDQTAFDKPRPDRMYYPVCVYFLLDPYSSFPAESMCNSVCCCWLGVESWVFAMVTECHQLHFTVSTLIHCVQCTKPHPPLHILSSPAAYSGLCYFLVCSQLLILIYRVQHCSSLLLNIVTDKHWASVRTVTVVDVWPLCPRYPY